MMYYHMFMIIQIVIANLTLYFETKDCSVLGITSFLISRKKYRRKDVLII